MDKKEIDEIWNRYRENYGKIHFGVAATFFQPQEEQALKP